MHGLKALTEVLGQLHQAKTELDTYMDAEAIGGQVDRQAVAWELAKGSLVLCTGLLSAVKLVAIHLGADVPPLEP
jgi:hypothetical protein